jgi:hypothetical protein
MEVRPNETGELGQPLHWVTIPAIGATNGEMCFGKELAVDCAADRVGEFFFAAPPWTSPAAPARRSTRSRSSERQLSAAAPAATQEWPRPAQASFVSNAGQLSAKCISSS